MSIFHFKEFSVKNEKSAMKVNTDGVLLGAIMDIFPSDKNILDIGAGTGTISLMAAQRRSKAAETIDESWFITGIDIDKDSSDEASLNFKDSPWQDHLKAYNIGLNNYIPEDNYFDLIFSNPPYFELSLQNPEQRKSTARHTNSLSYREIMHFTEEHLSANGRLALVLPAQTEKDLLRYGRMCGLWPLKITRIKTVPRKEPSRIIAEFSKIRDNDCHENEITILKDGKYTDEYLQLMHEFYLFA